MRIQQITFIIGVVLSILGIIFITPTRPEGYIPTVIFGLGMFLIGTGFLIEKKKVKA